MYFVKLFVEALIEILQVQNLHLMLLYWLALKEAQRFIWALFKSTEVELEAGMYCLELGDAYEYTPVSPTFLQNTYFCMPWWSTNLHSVVFGLCLE